jgi:hypothetical protein
MNDMRTGSFTKTSEPDTYTGNRGLQIEEPLIFESGALETSGVDLEEPEPFESRLGDMERQDSMGLPGLSEPDTMRHYVRLSRMNYALLHPGVSPHMRARSEKMRDELVLTLTSEQVKTSKKFAKEKNPEDWARELLG